MGEGMGGRRDDDDEEASLLAMLANMEDGDKEEEGLMKEINSLADQQGNPDLELIRAIKAIGSDEGPVDEAADLEKAVLALPDEDDLEAMVNALSDDEGPATSVDDLKQQIRNEKLEALKYKRAGDVNRAKMHLRRSKELQAEVDRLQREEAVTETTGTTTSSSTTTKEEYTMLAVQARRDGKMDLARKYLRLSKSPSAKGSREEVSVNAAAAAPAVLEIPAEVLASQEEVGDLRKRIKEEKVEAVKAKRAGNLEEARARLRVSKELQKKLDELTLGA